MDFGPRSTLRIEAIARAAHGDEVTGLLGVDLEALAELADEVVDRPHRAGGLAPHLVEQLGAREHLARVADEEHQELELEVSQLDLDAVAHDGALREVDRDVVEAELVVLEG